MALLDQFGKPLTLSQHNSIEHAIGEELPAPTIILPNGGRSSLGTSSVPAREDHVHTGGIPVYANAAARSAGIPSPVYGDRAILDDLDVITMYNGTKWIYLQFFGAWLSYTGFSISQSNAITYTLQSSHYKHEGSQVTWKAHIDITGAGTFGSFILVALPVAMSHAGERLSGSAQYYDASTTTRFILHPEWNTSLSIIGFGAPTTGGTLFGSNPNVVAASGDQLRLEVTYYALQ